MLIPMAISLAYGILFGTVFILIILPVLVILTNRMVYSIKKWHSDEEFEPEDVETAVVNAKIEATLRENMAKKFD
jgi:uncharacterized membrane protein